LAPIDRLPICMVSRKRTCWVGSRAIEESRAIAWSTSPAGLVSPMSPSFGVPVPDYVAELEKPVRGLRIGVAKEYLGEGLDKEVRSAIEALLHCSRELQLRSNCDLGRKRLWLARIP
jgi:hypothetical protein